MSGVFKQTDANRHVTYSDLPPNTPGKVDVLSSSGSRHSDEEARKAHQEAVTYIKEAQKRGPKIKDYLDYIQYLRDKGRFWRWEKRCRICSGKTPRRGCSCRSPRSSARS
ncbi:hypothetical protein ACKZDW_10510 [Ralstonia syzygii subsp. celebesensis]